MIITTRNRQEYYLYDLWLTTDILYELSKTSLNNVYTVSSDYYKYKVLPR